NSNLMNSVTNSGAAALTALKNAEAISISAQKATIGESYNAQTAAITQALNAQTQAAVTSLNAVTSAGGTALAAQTSQDIAGITADAVAATAVAMKKIVKQMGGAWPTGRASILRRRALRSSGFHGFSRETDRIGIANFGVASQRNSHFAVTARQRLPSSRRERVSPRSSTDRKE